ncbi:MAG: hypothetical protein L0227_15110 [Chloroflexi bacterium]|nr:hypothetical protein [Chloroflexota bacterium]
MAAWAVAGLGLYLVLGVVSLFVVGWVRDPLVGLFGLRAETGTSGWGVWLAAQPIAWGVSTAIAAAWLGRRLMPKIRFSPGGATTLAVGVALAATTTFLVHEFVRARHGRFDPDATGFVVFVAPAMVAIGLAGWAAAAVDRSHRGVLVALQAAALVGLGIALLPSVPGVQDGIRSSSVPWWPPA